MRHFTTTCKCQLLPASSSHLTTLRQSSEFRSVTPAPSGTATVVAEAEAAAEALTQPALAAVAAAAIALAAAIAATMTQPSPPSSLRPLFLVYLPRP